MVDIHSHILPGLDDGSPSMETTLQMLAQAVAAGTTDIVATPHASPNYAFDPEAVNARVAEVRAAAPPGINIHQGADFHIDYDLVQDALAHPRRYSINGGPYLLIELPERVPLRTVPQVVETLMRAGLTPILTHPERYFLLRGKVDEVKQWAASGCLVQVTAQSLTGMFGSTARKMCEDLLDARAVHFVASDAHDTQNRTTRLDAAREWLTGRYGAPRAEQLLEHNPRATLTGQPLPPSGEGSRKAGARERRPSWKFWG